MRARVNANEAAALAALHTVSTAAQSFRGANPGYPTILASMAAPNVTPPYIDSILGCTTQPCAKQGYSFSLTGSTNTFTAIATPQTFETSGVRAFFTDVSGVIRWTDQSGVAPVVGDSALQ